MILNHILNIGGSGRPPRLRGDQGRMKTNRRAAPRNLQEVFMGPGGLFEARGYPNRPPVRLFLQNPWLFSRAASFGHLGVIMGRSWDHLGASLGHPTGILSYLRVISAILGPSRAAWGPTSAILVHLGRCQTLHKLRLLYTSAHQYNTLRFFGHLVNHALPPSPPVSSLSLPFWNRLGAVLGHLGAALGPSWGDLGPS